MRYPNWYSPVWQVALQLIVVVQYLCTLAVQYNIPQPHHHHHHHEPPGGGGTLVLNGYRLLNSCAERRR